MDESKSLFNFHSKRELAENFSLEELIKFTRQKDLQKWFAENFYASEARKVAEEISVESSGAELKLLLCKLFDLSPDILSTSELEEVSEIVARNHRRKLFMQRIPGDDRKAAFVERQGELVRALNDDAKLIYLYGGEFRIPLNRRGITYVGCENAVIDFDEEFDLNLDACEIVLENVQVYLHHAINLQAANSKNVKIINGSKKILGVRPTLKEIFEILRGRRAFESAENFKARAEEIRGAAVGVVLLEDKDYTIETAQFQFQPRWDFEYISVLRDFIADKKFSVKVHSKDVANLYSNERKLQIFADFTYRGGKLTILNLYFDTKTLGRVAILITEIISSVSSGFGLGYGLDIINNYEPKFGLRVWATTTIKNEHGIHGRPALNFVQRASAFKSKIQLKANGKTVDAKGAVLWIMGLGLVKGTEVTIIAEGSDAQEAVKALIKLVDNRCNCNCYYCRWS